MLLPAAYAYGNTALGFDWDDGSVSDKMRIHLLNAGQTITSSAGLDLRKSVDNDRGIFAESRLACEGDTLDAATGLYKLHRSKNPACWPLT